MDLTILDIAKLLRVSELKVRQWIEEGYIPAYRLGNELRFDRLELENWLIQYGMPQESGLLESEGDDQEEYIDAEERSKQLHSNPLQAHELKKANNTFVAQTGVNQQQLQELLKEFSHEQISLKNEQAAQEETILDQGMLKYDLYRAIHRGEVYQEDKVISKELLIRQTTDRFAAKYPVQSDTLYEFLVARERIMSTAMGQGIAIPHTRDFLLDTHFDVIGVVYPKEPLEYGAIDHQYVHTLFFLFACSDRTHLHLLAKIASFCQQKTHLRLLQSKPEKAKLLDAILRWEKQL